MWVSKAEWARVIERLGKLEDAHWRLRAATTHVDPDARILTCPWETTVDTVVASEPYSVPLKDVVYAIAKRLKMPLTVIPRQSPRSPRLADVEDGSSDE